MSRNAPKMVSGAGLGPTDEVARLKIVLQLTQMELIGHRALRDQLMSALKMQRLSLEMCREIKRELDWRNSRISYLCGQRNALQLRVKHWEMKADYVKRRAAA